MRETVKSPGSKVYYWCSLYDRAEASDPAGHRERFGETETDNKETLKRKVCVYIFKRMSGGYSGTKINLKYHTSENLHLIKTYTCRWMCLLPFSDKKQYECFTI